MKDRKLIFVSCLGLFLIVALCFILFFLFGSFNRSNNIPVSYPTGPDNIVELNPEDEADFDFAVITDEGTIELRNQLNETSIINLEKKSWHNISWSPDNKHIAVLGETEEDVFNIFVYTVEGKKWSQLSFYTESSGGVGSFGWVTPSNIYFIQGLENDTWLHTLNIDAQANSIVKINKQSGSIVRVSDDGNNLVIKDGASFKIVSVIGATVNVLSSITFENSSNQSVSEPITDVYFPDNSAQVIYWTSNSNNIIADIDASSGTLLSNLSNATICTRKDSLTGYKVNGNSLEVSEGNINNELTATYKLELSKAFEVNRVKSICYNSDNFLINLSISGNQRWYFQDGGKMEVTTVGTKAIEITAKN